MIILYTISSAQVHAFNPVSSLHHIDGRKNMSLQFLINENSSSAAGSGDIVPFGGNQSRCRKGFAEK